MSPQLQLVPPVPPPVGLYFRPGWNDHIVVRQVLAENRAPTGLVFESRFGDRHRDLVEAAIGADLDAVLDPGSLELWTPAGRALNGLENVPWSWVADETAPALMGEQGRRFVRQLVDEIAKTGVRSVLAPTHYLAGVDDPNLIVDRLLAARLGEALAERGLPQVRVYYPLAMPARALTTEASRERLVRDLVGMDVDAFWLRLHPFGTAASGPHSLRRYIDVCVALRSLHVPILAERTGTVGLSLLSFNLVGGVESGVTVGETFNASRLMKSSTAPAGSFGSSGMVYLDALDTYVTRKEGGVLLARRPTLAALGCRDATCCRRGPGDMIRDPRRHGLIKRIHDVVEIGNTPAHRRPERYLARVTNAGNLAARLAVAHPTLDVARRRLDSWRGTFSALPAQLVFEDAPEPAVGHLLRHADATPQLRAVRDQ